jgi:Tol biopolymer transport system component
MNKVGLLVCGFPACTDRRILELPKNFRVNSIRFTPDGRAIAYADWSGANIWALPIDGGPPRQITHFTDRTITAFAWSRDGKRLAVARTTTTNDIVLLKLRL